MTTDPKTVLLACPFCDEKPIIQYVSFNSPPFECDPRYVKCTGCHSRTGMWDHDNEVIAAWNRRSSSPAFDAVAKALEHAHEAIELMDGYSNLEAEIRAALALAEKVRGNHG